MLLQHSFTPKKKQKKQVRVSPFVPSSIGGPRRCAFMRPPQTHPHARPAGAATSAGVAVPVVLTGAANLAVINFQKNFLRKFFLNNFRGKPDKCGCRRPGRPHGRGQLGGNKLPEKNP